MLAIFEKDNTFLRLMVIKLENSNPMRHKKRGSRQREFMSGSIAHLNIIHIQILI